jgi:hypothetical protein
MFTFLLRQQFTQELEAALAAGDLLGDLVYKVFQFPGFFF